MLSLLVSDHINSSRTVAKTPVSCVNLEISITEKWGKSESDTYRPGGLNVVCATFKHTTRQQNTSVAAHASSLCHSGIIIIFTFNLSVNKLPQVFVWGHFMCYILFTERCVLFVYSLRWSISGHRGATESFSLHICSDLTPSGGGAGGGEWTNNPFLLLTSPRVFGIQCSTFRQSTGQHSSPVPAGGNAALPRCSVSLVSKLLCWQCCESVWPHHVIFFLVSVHARFFLLENLCFQSPRPVARRRGWKASRDGDGCLHLFSVSLITPVCVCC